LVTFLKALLKSFKARIPILLFVRLLPVIEAGLSITAVGVFLSFETAAMVALCWAGVNVLNDNNAADVAIRITSVFFIFLIFDGVNFFLRCFPSGLHIMNRIACNKGNREGHFF